MSAPLIVDARGVPYVPCYGTPRWMKLSPLWVIPLLLFLMGVLIQREHARRSGAVKEQSSLPPGSYISTGTTYYPGPVSYGDTPLQSATAEHERSLDRALSAWHSQLPLSFKVKRPRLLEGTPSTCENYEAIACADLRNNQIVIAVRKCECDIDTILMHEVGHLLGVPHIESDPLMNPSYAGKLERPSEQAVALALLHRK